MQLCDFSAINILQIQIAHFLRVLPRVDNVPLLGPYWPDAASIGPVQARYWQLG